MVGDERGVCVCVCVTLAFSFVDVGTYVARSTTTRGPTKSKQDSHSDALRNGMFHKKYGCMADAFDPLGRKKRPTRHFYR
jgi:hypothetical protein